MANLKLNTGELAVVRILIKRKKMTPSEIAAEDKVAMMMAREGKLLSEQSIDKSDLVDHLSDAAEEHELEEGKQTEPVERFMELEQNDLALAITGRPQGLQYSALVMHEYAQRVHRKDFVEQVVRQCADFF